MHSNLFLSIGLCDHIGIKNRNNYYFYTRLVFGSRSSPKIFDYLSSVLCWIFHENYGVNHVLHLLDDFLTVDAPDYEATRTMTLIHHVFAKLGVPLSKKKTIGPCTDRIAGNYIGHHKNGS